jgi:adenylylsulfate kinase-like enzyme
MSKEEPARAGLTSAGEGTRAEGVLLTGVYGSGKSSVAAELAYLLEQRDQPYALPDLDYLRWAGTGTDDRAAEARFSETPEMRLSH